MHQTNTVDSHITPGFSVSVGPLISKVKGYGIRFFFFMFYRSWMKSRSSTVDVKQAEVSLAILSGLPGYPAFIFFGGGGGGGVLLFVLKLQLILTAK